MSLGKGNRNRNRNQETTTTRTTPVVPQFVRQQQQQVFDRANQFQPQVYSGPRVAQPTADQSRFFDQTRDYVDRAMDRPQPVIDTSALEALQDRSVDTSGVMGMLGQRADTSALADLMGQRADTTALQAAQQATTDTSGLQALMGRQNQAAGLFDALYNSEVTTGLNDSIRAAADDALAREQNLYANAGRLGSGAFGRAVAEGTTRAISPILMQSAENDRAARFRAADTLAQIYGADMARDIGLTQAQVAAQQADLARSLSGAQMLTNAELQGLSADIGIGGMLADADERAMARDLGIQQYATNMAANDLARQQAIAQNLAGLDVSQAQLNAARQGQDIGLLQLLERSGAAQQGQRQAEIAAAQQFIADQNAAAQQRYNNQLAAAGLGSNYIGSNVVTTSPGENSSGGGLFNTLLGGASLYAGLNAPGLEMIPVVGAPLKAGLLAANSLGLLRGSRY